MRPWSQVSKREIDERFERGEMTFDGRRLSQDNAFAAIAAKCPQQRVSICKIDGQEKERRDGTSRGIRVRGRGVTDRRESQSA